MAITPRFEPTVPDFEVVDGRKNEGRATGDKYDWSADELGRIVARLVPAK